MHSLRPLVHRFVNHEALLLSRCGKPRIVVRRRSFSSVSCSVQHDDNDRFRVYNALDGCIDYRIAWAWQQVLLHRRLAARRRQEADDADVVLLLQHEPVYTLGRGADENNLLFLRDNPVDDPRRVALSRKTRGGARLSVDRHAQAALLMTQDDDDDNDAAAIQRLLASLSAAHDDNNSNSNNQQQSPPTVVLAPNGVPIYRVERGGEVTWHGPGQLVVYPLVDLQQAPFQADLHWFLRQIEQVIIDVLEQEYDIAAVRDDINTGVWVNQHKIAAVGVAASRWITTHGFALNVHADLEYFDTSVILPCGIEERGVTSIAQVLTERGDGDVIPTVAQVGAVVLGKMEQVFGVTGLIQSNNHVDCEWKMF